MSDIYPEIKNLFAGLQPRKVKYTPEQLIEQFSLYLDDLRSNPIEVETDYKRQSNQGSKDSQRRAVKYPRPPKITDFICRWLGMSQQAWYQLPSRKTRGDDYRKVIDSITQYCFDVKYDGAMVGIYNAAIVTRELGLGENVKVTNKVITESMPDEELERLKDYGRQMGYI